MNILVADLVRVMRNVSPLCKESERTVHVQHFINRMQYSGYDQKERTDVYMKALTNFEKIKEKARVGEIPMYRSKFWMQKEREKEKVEKKRKLVHERGLRDSSVRRCHTELNTIQ